RAGARLRQGTWERGSGETLGRPGGRCSAIIARSKRHESSRNPDVMMSLTPPANVPASDEGPRVDFLHSELFVPEDTVVHVTLAGQAANVRLLDDVNFARFRRGESFTSHAGGYYTRPPVVL